MDSAGNWGGFGESEGVLAIPKNDSRCELDKSGPRIEIRKINETCTSIKVEIHCTDATSCKNIMYGQHRTSSSCVADRNYLGGSINFDKKGWLCYSAEDGNGNNISDTEIINFKDEDGDGVADSCDLCQNTLAGHAVSGDGCSFGEIRDNEKATDTDGEIGRAHV